MKRLFDIIFSIVAIVILALPMAVIAIIILATDGRPVVFRQERVGLGNKTFRIRKFRSMKVGTKNVATKDLKNSDDCITPIGKVLRKTSLDELPQLVNILKGEMSFVGPRPVVKDELEKYGSNKDRFLSVKPGLTGYWATHGRSDISYEERMELELYYVDNASLWLDIKIFFLTFVAVFMHKGAC